MSMSDESEERQLDAYEEYIKSERWHRKKQERLDFARNRCELCYSLGGLDVHHRTYERLGQEDLEDIVALCHRCHSVFHRRLSLHAPAQPKRFEFAASDGEAVMAAFQAIEEAASGERLMGVPSGFHDLDDMTGGWQPGNVTVIAGRPSMGTTSFVLSAAMNAATHPKHGVPTLVFSTEMSEPDVMRRLLMAEARVDSQKALTGRLTDEDWPLLARAAGRIEAANLHVETVTDDLIGSIASEIRAAQRKDKVGLVIVDSLNSLDVGEVSNSQRVRQMASFMRTLKNTALLELTRLGRQFRSIGRQPFRGSSVRG